MNYNSYILKLLFRILVISTGVCGIAFFIHSRNYIYASILGITLTYVIFNLYTFIKSRFLIINDFFEAVKYRDFSRWFAEEKGPKDIQFLYGGFNEINKTIKEVNSKSEAQFVYLQKILEMVDIGIIAYNLETGDVLWNNHSFREILEVPSFKNIRFIEIRKPKLFETIFETYHREPTSTTINLQNEKLKILISETIFEVEEGAFKLIAIQNIDHTLNKNESESWKKLLSVMTHEIMNSIAPISSLSDTLQKNLQSKIDNPEKNKLELNDLNIGIKTIKNRSEGLLKFAKTYRSLNKVTNLNLERSKVSELFDNIKLLMEPSLKAKNIDIEFLIKTPRLSLNIDKHLIEQVLINLIVNAIDACKNTTNPEIKVIASQNSNKNTVIKVFDNGYGIPENILESIFIPFFTSKSTGSGIGLSLCKQIMLLHKGKILVKSIEGKGTMFSLVF